MAKRRIRKTKKGPPIRPVAFCCHAPTAQAVFVAGEFNGWDPKATAMVRGDDGAWTLELDLPPGRYEFKFVVDGQWCCEPGTDDSNPECECVPNLFGTMNRVLKVATATQKTRAG